jgi:PAS domain S-box-containing protein
MKILYVEDNPTDVTLAKREIGKGGAGFEVEVAGTCAEALAKLKNDSGYDVVLLDLRLPDGDGISVLSEIREKELPICVIVMTAFGDEEVAVGALKAGADDYVVKSGKHFKQLPTILNNNLGNRERSLRKGTRLRVLFAGSRTPEFDVLEEYIRHKALQIQFEALTSAADVISRISRKEVDIDVLLLDYGLPGMRPLELIKEIRVARGLDLPIVVLAGQGDQETAALTMKIGADDYVVKSESFHLRLPMVLENVVQKAKLRREQEALRHSEERYRIISSLMSDYAYAFKVTPEGKLEGDWITESFEKKFGYTQAEVAKRGGWQSMVYPADLPVINEHVKKVVGGSFDVAEFRFVTRAGNLVWLRDSAKPIFDPRTRAVVKIYGAAQDITERRNTEDEIRRSEMRFKELADFLPQPVFEIDESRTVSFANRACLDVFGLTEEEYKHGLSLIDFVAPEERERALSEIEKVFKGAPGEPERYTVVGKGGATFPALVSASPIMHDSRVVGLRGILVDLSELTAANEAITASENRYRFLFESSADESFMVDQDARFMQVNEAGCELLGYTRDEIIGERVDKILAPEAAENAEDRINQIFTHKEVTFESVHLRKDGTRVPVEVRSRAVSFEGRTVFLATARDLTARKKAEEAIAQRNRQLKILSTSSVNINSVLNVSDILRTLVMSGVELVGATAGTVGLIEQGKLVFREYFRPDGAIPIDVRFAAGQGTPGYVLASKRARITNDSSSDPLVIRELHEKFGIRNAVDVPIVSRTGEVLGAFAIHNSVDSRPFTESDVEMLEGLAASASVALENAAFLAGMTKAEIAIRESEQKFRTLVESSLVGVYIIQDGKFVYTNPAMSRMYGYSQDEFLGMSSVLETVAQEDHAAVMENIRKRIDAETESIKYDFTSIRKSGERLRIEVFGSRTVYGGRPAVIGTAEDITERKLAEEKLKRSEERYRSLFEESIDAIYVTTPAGKILDINTAGVKLFGFDSRSEMLALDNVKQLYANPEERDRSNRAVEADGFIRDNLITVIRRDGTQLIVQDSATVIRDPEGHAVAYRGILRDVTEKKKLEEQLLQSQKLESLGQLTSGIAHDFNNVLGGIIGFTELALGKIEENHPVNSYLMRIYGLADRAAKITKQLLAFARRQILMPRELNLNELIADILELLRRLLGEQIQITFVPGAELKTVLADASQVEQVLLNLAVNAGDAMQHGGILMIETGNSYLDEFYCRTHTNVKPGEYVVVTVTDTGTGIEPATLDHIFEPFFTTKEVGKGTGLGLAVVHGIIRQHGGTINVYSETGKGTTFRVYFPAVKGPAGKSSDHSDLSRQISRGSETVLVVEDNEEMREFMQTLLVESGYTVLTASDGEEGMAVFEPRAGDISLVISDIVMPKMSGKALKEAVDRKYPGSRFLFISGYTDSAVHHGFILDDHVDFLQKPFTAFEFGERVRKILDRKSG